MHNRETAAILTVTINSPAVMAAKPVCRRKMG
jgi:hypothetical protein